MSALGFRPRPCHFSCPPTNRWHCSMPPGTPQAHWGQMGTMPGPHRALKPQQLAKKCKKRHFWPFPALSGPSHLDCFCTIVAGALPHNLGLVHCTPPWPKVCAKCFQTPQNSGESAKNGIFALPPLFWGVRKCSFCTHFGPRGGAVHKP